MCNVTFRLQEGEMAAKPATTDQDAVLNIFKQKKHWVFTYELSRYFPDMLVMTKQPKPNRSISYSWTVLW